MAKTAKFLLEPDFSKVTVKTVMVAVGQAFFSIGVVAAWLLGFFSILSFNEWSDLHPLGFIPAFAERTIFDTLDFFAANILLLVGGLLTSIFIGWLVPKKIQQEAIGVKDGAFYRFWRIIVRYIVPPLLFVILIMGLI